MTFDVSPEAARQSHVDESESFVLGSLIVLYWTVHQCEEYSPVQ